MFFSAKLISERQIRIVLEGLKSQGPIVKDGILLPSSWSRFVALLPGSIMSAGSIASVHKRPWRPFDAISWVISGGAWEDVSSL